MKRPTVNVMYWPGTNCERETLFAFQKVGADARVIFLQDLVAGRAQLDGADILCLPGGFSYGDHAGGGTLAALSLKAHFADQLERCRSRPILCICNGFQIGIRAGLFGPDVTLTDNESGTFSHLWDQPHIVADDNESRWLAGLQGKTLRFPCAHGEGRLVYRRRGDWRVALRYPSDRNPDGSSDDIAGITTGDGLVLGLMNHPERNLRGSGNLDLFENGVEWVRG